MVYCGTDKNQKIQITNEQLNSKSILTYGVETRNFNKNLYLELMSMELDFLRRSARRSGLEEKKNTNNVIR